MTRFSPTRIPLVALAVGVAAALIDTARRRFERALERSIRDRGGFAA